MEKYLGKLLKKGRREVHVLAYEKPDRKAHVPPCGTRRGHYLVEVGGIMKKMRTEKVSRLHTEFGYALMDTFGGCYLFCHHALKKQEQIQAKKESWMRRFLNFISGE